MSFTTNLNMNKPTVGGDASVWGTELNADLDVIDALFAPDGTGTSVGLNVGANKVLTLGPGSNAIVNASSLEIIDDGDNTKVAMFSSNLITTGTTRTYEFPDQSGPLLVLLQNFLGGLSLSNNVSVTNTKIDVSAGQCANDTNTTMLTLTSGTINTGTTGADGLDTGSLQASTWYHTFAIGKTNGTTSRLASTSLSPSLPSGYSLKRRIGSFMTDASSHIISFLQYGDTFYWLTPMTDSTKGAEGPVNVIVSVPLGVNVIWLGGLVAINTGSVGTNYQIQVYSPVFTAPGPTVLAAGTGGTATTSAISATTLQVLTSNASRITYLGTGAHLSCSIGTIGWVDLRGKNS